MIFAQWYGKSSISRAGREPGRAGRPTRIAAPVGPISLTTSIDAPRERVFDFICDLGDPAQLDRPLRQRLPPRAHPGAAGRAPRRASASTLPRASRYMETVIAEADRPYRIVEHGRGGRLDRIPIRIVWELEEGPTTTVDADVLDRSDHRVRPGPGARADAVVAAALGKALRRMRELIESGRRAPRTEVAGGDRLPAAVA